MRDEFTKAQREQIGDALLDIIGTEPLTRRAETYPQQLAERAAWLRESNFSWETIGQNLGVSSGVAERAAAEVAPELADQTDRWKRAGIRKPQFVDRVVVLRQKGYSYAQISDAVGIAVPTAIAYVALAAPELRLVDEITRRGGRPPGAGSKLTDAQLRNLHRVYFERNVPVLDVARETYRAYGFASAQSAAVSMRRGWKRLGLKVRPAREAGRRCRAIKTQSPRKGSRCTRYTLLDSEFCVIHDPRRREAVMANAFRMRERSGVGALK